MTMRLGVRTRASGNGTTWAALGAGLDSFGRVGAEGHPGASMVTVSGTITGAQGVQIDVDGDEHLTVDATAGSWSTSIPFEAGPHRVEVFPWDPHLGSLPKPSETRDFTVSAGSQYAASGIVNHTYDASGYLIKRTYSDGRVRKFFWDVQGRLLKVTERNGSGNGWDWHQVYDPMGQRLNTTYVPVVANMLNYTQAKDTKSYFDPEVTYLEIGVRRWGHGLTDETLWKFYGPDLSDTYGGLQGIGGLEAVWNQATGELWQTINDSVGDLVSHMHWGGSSYTHTAITTEVTSYGPSNTEAAASSAWATTSSTKLIDATFWRGYRIDPTGLYWMGARHYDPQGGRFISPDPLGHAASEDLYSYADGDPVNYVDPLGLDARSDRPPSLNGLSVSWTNLDGVPWDQARIDDKGFVEGIWPLSPYPVNAVSQQQLGLGSMMDFVQEGMAADLISGIHETVANYLSQVETSTPGSPDSVSARGSPIGGSTGGSFDDVRTESFGRSKPEGSSPHVRIPNEVLASISGGISIGEYRIKNATQRYVRADMNGKVRVMTSRGAMREYSKSVVGKLGNHNISNQGLIIGAKRSEFLAKIGRNVGKAAAGLGAFLILVDLASNEFSSRSLIKASLGIAVIGLGFSGIGAPAALAISLAYAALDGFGEIDRELDRWGVAR